MKKIVDYSVSQNDICQMNDDTLAELFMYACRDKDEIEVANTVYWWCVKEINIRIELEGSNNVN